MAEGTEVMEIDNSCVGQARQWGTYLLAVLEGILLDGTCGVVNKPRGIHGVPYITDQRTLSGLCCIHGLKLCHSWCGSTCCSVPCTDIAGMKTNYVISMTHRQAVGNNSLN